MNIAFDAIGLLGPMSKNRGIGNYCRDQLKKMIEIDPDNEYFFFNVCEETELLEDEISTEVLKESRFHFMHEGDFFAASFGEEAYGAVLRKFLKENKIDVFYITSPFDIKLPMYKKEWFEGVKTVATVYDIIPYVFIDHYFPKRSDAGWYLERIEMLRWVDKLVAISQSAKDDLVEYLDFPEESVDVIWGAPGEMFKKIDIPEKTRDKICRKFGIKKPYVMCTGGDDERKNIASLIEAFGKLPKKVLDAHQLVIVCKLTKASVERYTNLGKENGIGDNLVLTNFVTDDELVALYNMSKMVAFPSTYEGFGLPVVEAWACGKPVLTSNNSSLGQIAGDACITVDPFSVDSIADGLEEALTEADLDELIQKGAERLKVFSWKAVAARTIETMNGLAAEKDEKPAKKKQDKKRKIAFFTPLPPIRSGIADYSADILSELSRYYDIDVFIDDDYEVECELPDNVTVYNHAVYEKKHNEYKKTVYQLGNSLYHVYMWPYLKKYKGIQVLHDYNLHGVAQAYTLAMNHGGREGYRAMLLEDFTREEVDGYFDYMSRTGKMKVSELEMNGFALNYTDKVIVHSRDSKQKLMERNVGRNVRVIRLYAKIEPLPDVKKAKEELDLPTDGIVFASFGHVHETKRAIPVLRAFAKLHQQNEKTHLVYVGEVAETIKDAFEDEIEKLGISDAVTVTGYVDLDDFTHYIDASDVCLNLRWPYNGETSASLMRILAKAKCVVVNDIGSFSEIPDEACIKLPSVASMSENKEVDAICKAMTLLAGDAEKRKTYSKEARAFAERELDLKKIAKEYADFIEDDGQMPVTEDLLGKLRAVILEKNLKSDEIREIAKTLAYLYE